MGSVRSHMQHALTQNPSQCWCGDRVSNIICCRSYVCRVCVDGEWRLCLIDDFFPATFKPTGPGTAQVQFAFSKASDDRLLWVLLLEKATAKMFGTYAALESGVLSYTLPRRVRHTTGKQCHVYGTPHTALTLMYRSDFGGYGVADGRPDRGDPAAGATFQDGALAAGPGPGRREEPFSVPKSPTF
jgi:hypothetical protein